MVLLKSHNIKTLFCIDLLSFGYVPSNLHMAGRPAGAKLGPTDEDLKR
jgi:hypothetical protein